MPGIGFGRREAAFAVDRGEFAQFREGDLGHAGAGIAQHRARPVRTAAATAGSTSFRTKLCGTAKRAPRTGMGRISPGSSPAIMASRVAQQATEFASGPTLSSVKESGSAPSRGTRAAVGLKPTMPVRAAGMRQEPPVSVPIAPKAIRSVIEMAAPDEDPPGMRPPLGSGWPRARTGLRGVP